MNSDDGAKIKPKRGRRSKKEIEAAKNLAEMESQTQSNVIIEEPIVENTTTNKNVEIENNIEFKIDGENSEENEDSVIPLEDNEENVIIKQGNKKRGRKPKGGKIVQQITPTTVEKESRPNIILHLKCSLKDLTSSGDHNSNFTTATVDPYNFECNNEFSYELLNNSNFTNNESVFSVQNTNQNQNTNKIYAIKDTNYSNDDDEIINANTNETRELWRKLKILEQDLHINNISDKKSACFWCSCDFDSPPIYIPKHFIKDSYHVYGCFCTPECGVAYLMEENIDSSTKFERYHLMNHIYSKIYEYKKNIKPAPNPHYMLDKYYGNLTIQEYRALLRSERLFLIVDKPLTRILPEFHEDNDDFIINNKIIPSNNYQVKKRLQKKIPQTKSNILNEKFGIQNVVAPAQ
uniref:MYM-type domain-containing protein n=1 Tax=viral metagenome TaxID=1070528 RepID=A0A6C0HCR9_9ZZZZ